MNESLFSRLFHYHATEKRTPQEDYLTELLAWMIDSLPQFRQDYVTFLCDKSESQIQFNEKCSVNSKTQVIVSEGRIDMMITVGSSSCFICEHKVDSCLRENQISDYRDCEEEIKEQYGVDDVYYVFLSKIEDKLEKEQKPDIIVRWHDIYKYFSKKQYENNSFESMIVQQFLDYLTEVGMGMKNVIRSDDVKFYCGAMRLLPTLKSIFDELSINVKWEEECKGISGFVSDYRPLSVNNKFEKRIGITFSTTWEPSIFAGVVYSNEDHELKDFHDQPQLVVLIDCKNPEFTKQYKARNSKWLNTIKTNDEFIVENNPKSKWRALILKKALTEVLADADEESYENQKDAIKNKIIDGIRYILDQKSKQNL